MKKGSDDKRRPIVLAAAAVLALAVSAEAQAPPQKPAPKPTPAPTPTPATRAAPRGPGPQWTDIARFGVNGGRQMGLRSFGHDDAAFGDRYAEDGRFGAEYPIEDAIFFDASGVVRLWKNIGAGGAFSRYRAESGAAVSAAVPHPFFFERNRLIDAEQPATREQTVVQLHGVIGVPISQSVLLTAVAGPAFVSIRQTMVDGVDVSETYPFDVAAITGVDLRTARDSVVGFSAGVGVDWMFTRALGVGALVRYQRATADLETWAGNRVSVDVGGLQVGAGIRIAAPQRRPARPTPRPQPPRPPRKS
jgi:hypothetical protein